MEFVLIPTGKFLMGSPSDEQGRWDAEGPVHEVIIKTSFYMGKFLVTQRQWEKVMGNNPSKFRGEDRPVENISWNNAQEFIKKLNQIEGTDKYRLPSEAEWEYACRAGTTTRYSFGDKESELSNYAWYFENSGSETHPVGLKKPNPLGLYDMHGNVWEWCQDKWHDNYNRAPSYGSVWGSGNSSSRVNRGGGWNIAAKHCRSKVRSWEDPGICNSILGFRILRKL
jgi:formylglycine-generating enzyme required for sulfatase activity